jgi:subtilisin
MAAAGRSGARSPFRIHILLLLAMLLASSAAVAGPDEERGIVAYPRDIAKSDEAGRSVAQLLDRARKRGKLRLIVGLDAAVADESGLAPSAVQAQRRRVAAAQDGLLRRNVGTRLSAKLESLPFVVLEADQPALQRLLTDPGVLSVQEDVAAPLLLRESVPLIGGDVVAKQGFGGAGQTVAVLDTGVDGNHPMLRGKVVAEACYSTRTIGYTSSLCPGGAASSTKAGSGKPCPSSIGSCYHGTHVAGIAAGNTTGIAGVARGAKLISIQVFTRFDTAGSCAPQAPPCLRSYTSDQLKAMERVYALRTAYKIASVNLSLGGGLYTEACDAQNPAMTAAVQKLRGVGIATVIAAGNDGLTGYVGAPGCISSAVTVGSTTKTDTVSSFSNLSPAVDILAPGSSITSALPGGAYGIASGTSMATPHIAGAYAVMRSAKPTASLDQILAALQASPIMLGRDGVDRPRIELISAVAKLRAPPVKKHRGQAAGELLAQAGR